MKNYKLILLLLITIISYKTIAQSYSADITWGKVKEIKTENTIISVLEINEGFLDIDNNFIPVFSDLIPNNSYKSKITFNNFIYDIEALSSNDINKLSKELLTAIPSNPQLDLRVVKSNNKEFVSVKLIPLIKQNGSYYKITSFKFDYSLSSERKNINYKSDFNNDIQLIDGSWKKLAIVNNGIHKITYQDLLDWNVISTETNSNSIAIIGNEGKMNPYSNQFSTMDSLFHIPIQIEDNGDGKFNEGDYLLFYGESSTDLYYDEVNRKLNYQLNDFTDTSYVFIGINDNFQKIIKTENSNNLIPSKTITKGNDVYYHEKEWLNFIKSGRNWVGEDFQTNNPLIFNIKLPDVITSENSILDFSAAVRSRNTSNNSITLFYNNDSISKVNYNPFSAIYYNDYARFNDVAINMKVNSESFDLKMKYSVPNQESVAWLNRFTINYIKTFNFSQKQSLITSIPNYNSSDVIEYQINNSSNSTNIQIWEITNFYEVKNINYTNSGNQLTFKKLNSSTNTFLVFDHDNTFKPIEKESITFKNLRSSPTPTLLIITHSDFLTQANKLADLHKNEDDLSVLIVNVKDIYNEFSSGRNEAGAIRNFIKYLYNNPGNDSLKYVQLFGDASQDPKKNASNKKNYIPAFQSINSTRLTGSFVSDDFYGMMDDNEGELNAFDQLDIAIGRLPVSEQYEANDLVEKIYDYYGKLNSNLTNSTSDHKGNWRNKIHFIADDGDNYEHMKQAEQLSVLVDSSIENLNISKVYVDAYLKVSTISKPLVEGAESAIENIFKQGGLIVNYTGHGGEYGWAEERILAIKDIKEMKNLNSYPLVVTATCEFSRFDDPDKTSAGEYLLMQKNGGAIALFTTVRLVFSIPNFRLNKSFYEVLKQNQNNKIIRLGDLFMQTKVQNNGGTNDRNFTLLGDPALKLVLPPNRINTNTISYNNIEVDTLKALNKLKIEGVLLLEDKSPNNNFNGTIDVSIYDKKFERLSLDNSNTGSQFPFTQQESLLSLNRFEVVNGKFSGEVILPKNLRSDYGIGKITYYAWNENSDYSGADKTYIIGGLDSTLLNDKKGPEIQLWMNDSSFTFGDAIEPQPTLIAALFDSSGINVSSQELGSSILLNLNNNTSTEYNLTSFYEPSTNKYYQGSVKYNLDEIKDGKHQLKLKASDNLNNESEAYTEFYIAESAPLAIEHLLNYPNPFTTNTSFYFEHNQTSQLEVMIRIYTISGILIKTIRALPNSEGNRVGPINWDGRDDFGDRIGRGVYIYKLTVQKENEKIEEINKLVILR